MPDLFPLMKPRKGRMRQFLSPDQMSTWRAVAPRGRIGVCKSGSQNENPFVGKTDGG
jgi:hypothetical protein